MIVWNKVADASYEKLKIMKKIMVIVLASTMGSYAYAQSGTTNSVRSKPSIVKKNKSKKPPPPPPLPPAPPSIEIPEVMPAPPPPPVPPVMEEGKMMAPPPPPPAPPPPPPIKQGNKKMHSSRIQRDIQ